MASDLRQLVAEREQSARTEDWYGLLGVPPDADDWSIRNAYFHLSRLIHPDRMGHPELREPATVIADALPRAFGTLIHESERRRYDRQREMGPSFVDQATRAALATREAVRDMERLLGTPAHAMGTEQPKVARLLAGRGAVLEREGRFDEAARYFARAAELDPKDPTYLRHHGWSIFNDAGMPDRERSRRAKPLLESAAARAPYDPEARYALACYWLEAGNRQWHRVELEAALRADPNHQRAAAALERLMEREAERPPVRRSLPFGLDRFFGD